MQMTMPTKDELQTAFAVKKRAEVHLLELMTVAAIPGASVHVWPGGGRNVMVTLRASKKVFLHPSGRRLYESLIT
jgi:hypothetical protein